MAPRSSSPIGGGTGNDQIRLYVDYELDGQMALTTGQYTLRPTIFRLGRDIRDTGFYYEGLLDEFRIVRGALGVGQFLQVVPEPSSFILLMVGGMGLMVGVVGRLLPVRQCRQRSAAKDKESGKAIRKSHV